jgi:nitroimidazol reductase NimA-like FMN-containing flavoprotein (pyridoxamine 5'-phosphate oxidase superfamily)
LKSKNFQESKDVIEKVLYEENLGYLGVSLDDKPLVVPLNYVYTEGKILFHCALEGKKLDTIRKNDEVCFTVARQMGTVEQHENNDPCHVDSASVMCFGKAKVIENLVERQKALNIFNKRFDPDAEEISLESTKNCMAVEIQINEMTARQEYNQECTYWRFEFRD